MKDREIKAKHPWMKFFVIGKDPKEDELERSQQETRRKLKESYRFNKFHRTSTNSND